MALRNSFEMPIGYANIKVTIELNDDISGASLANRTLMAQITGKVTSAIVQSGHREEVSKQAPVQAGIKRTKSEHIEITVMDWTRARRSYRVKPTTKLSEIWDREASHLAVSSDKLRFIYGGYRVSGSDTLEQNGIENGSILDVHMEQAGS